MGPRAFARGDLSAGADNWRDGLASMGPRAFARGDTKATADPGRNHSGFNGAASFRPRRSHNSEMAVSLIDPLQWGRELSPAEICCIGRSRCRTNTGFNGAASFRPRRCEAFASAWLQARGASMGPRAFARGDRDAGRVVTLKIEALQWGRELSPAEMGPWHQGAHRVRPLQWGRELSPAEIHLISKVKVALKLCFNGAASFRPRRFPDLSTGLEALKRFNGAASFRPRRSRRDGNSHLASILASMGPRAFARGDTPGGGWKVIEALALQWGRELSPAEICNLGFVPFAYPCFNGAASFRPRRFLDNPPLRAQLIQASMGPRAFARGDLNLPDSDGLSCWELQWGRELSPAEMRQRHW